MKKKIKFILKTVLVLIVAMIYFLSAFMLYVIWDNSRIAITENTVTFSNLPIEFDDTKICLITDYHNAEDYQKILAKVSVAEPEYIFVAGDVLSYEIEDLTVVYDFFKGLLKIAPVYYEYGNNEIWYMINHDSYEILDEFRNLGVTVLDNEVATIEKDGAEINIVGISDIQYPDGDEEHYEPHMTENINAIADEITNDNFTIAMFHRANQIQLVADSNLNCDLVLSGHIHGGQINLPKVRDIILEKMKVGNKYVKGLYKVSDLQMIVSSGAGNDSAIPRVFNTREIVSIKLNRSWSSNISSEINE